MPLRISALFLGILRCFFHNSVATEDKKGAASYDLSKSF